MNKMDKKVGFEISGSAYNVAPNSVYDVQVAPVSRRFLAFIIDITLFVFLAIGIGKVVTTPLVEAVFHYSEIQQQLEDKVFEFGFSRIDTNTGEYVLIDFSLPEEATTLQAVIQTHGPALVAAQLGEYDDVSGLYILLGEPADQVRKLETLFHRNEEVLALARAKSFAEFIQLIFSAFMSQLLLFFALPLILKNGQTLSMLLLRIGLVNSDGLRLRLVPFVVRFFLGFFLLGTGAIIFFYSLAPALGVIYGIVLLGLTLAIPKNRALHDLIGRTIVIDMDSQYIIDTLEEKIAAQKEEYRLYLANEKNKKKINK